MAIMEGEGDSPFEQQALAENFNGVPLWIRPQSFFQTNPPLPASCMPPPAMGAPAAGQSYVGSVRRGGFGLHCATPEMRLTGIEIAPEAIACAKQSAAELGLTNLHFQALDSTQFATARAIPSWCWSTRRAAASAASCATI
jgi:23S rRNA (uracil747-C5)-methyltransferase